MADVEITLTLPEELAEKARAAGLLTPERFADYLNRELLRSAAREELKTIVSALRKAAPSLTEEEIEAELALAKAERIAEAERQPTT
jgi:hypothetical protein